MIEQLMQLTENGFQRSKKYRTVIENHAEEHERNKDIKEEL